MKPLIFLLTLIFCISCSLGNNMEKINSLWQNVASCKSAQEEEAAIENVWSFISDKNISFEVLTANSGGDLTEINNLPSDYPIKKVKIIFKSGETNTSFEWTPIDIENIYILYRE